MRRLCFLDMDGVLADFVTGVSAAHGRTSPYTDDPDSLGNWHMEKLWEISAEEFWKPTQFDGFWNNLPKMPMADHLVEWACKKYGTFNVCILTAPSADSRCIPEKTAWIGKHYPDLKKNMIFGSAKRFLAGEGRVLIDDKDENISDFVHAGGVGIIYPQLWNSMWGYDKDPLSFVKSQLG